MGSQECLNFISFVYPTTKLNSVWCFHTVSQPCFSKSALHFLLHISKSHQFVKVQIKCSFLQYPTLPRETSAKSCPPLFSPQPSWHSYNIKHSLLHLNSSCAHIPSPILGHMLSGHNLLFPALLRNNWHT